jgi:hypothetical protein
VDEWGFTGELTQIPGSLSIVNYGDGSGYSTDSSRHPYKLYGYLVEVDDDEFEERCLLVSDQRVLQATIVRD